MDQHCSRIRKIVIDRLFQFGIVGSEHEMHESNPINVHGIDAGFRRPSFGKETRFLLRVSVINESACSIVLLMIIRNDK